MRIQDSARIVSAFIATLAFAACGGGREPATANDHGHGHEHAGHEHGEHGEEREHNKLSGPLKEFHAVLAPAWHETPGKARITKTCDSIEKMVETSRETKDSTLIARVAALRDECGDPVRDEVEDRLARVHERFHQLAE